MYLDRRVDRFTHAARIVDLSLEFAIQSILMIDNTGGLPGMDPNIEWQILRETQVTTLAGKDRSA